MNDGTIIIYNGPFWVSSSSTNCPARPDHNDFLWLYAGSWYWMSQESVFHRILERPLRTYWSSSLTVISSVCDQVLLESCFLLAEAGVEKGAGIREEQDSRKEEYRALLPALLRTSNQTWSSKSNTLSSNLKLERATSWSSKPSVLSGDFMFWKKVNS